MARARDAGEAVQARQRASGARTAQLGALARQALLTPAQRARLRAHVLGLLRAQIPLAHRVVMGEVQWTPTQSRLFAALLDKCVPELPPNFGARDPEHGHGGRRAASRRGGGTLATGGEANGPGA
ncbi:hypothetical protein [Amaricoccus solimangrovi]|uniref:Uncharacterized protein n=1 Tax=Amaricoccus solimangrovi TaxID=2589815 RepID=A0A501WFN3_9RHOB|nr:hypothetical protein [Amaricoccus solimangrovi]TPE47170.1 hypothetical protein FJM51_20605 [Amaricoccus solimangrovi]